MRVLLLTNENQTGGGLNLETFSQRFSLVIHGAIRMRHFATVEMLVFSQKLDLMFYLATDKRAFIKVDIPRTVPEAGNNAKNLWMSIL